MARCDAEVPLCLRRPWSMKAQCAGIFIASSPGLVDPSRGSSSMRYPQFARLVDDDGSYPRAVTGSNRNCELSLRSKGRLFFFVFSYIKLPPLSLFLGLAGDTLSAMNPYHASGGQRHLSTKARNCRLHFNICLLLFLIFILGLPPNKTQPTMIR